MLGAFLQSHSSTNEHGPLLPQAEQGQTGYTGLLTAWLVGWLTLNDLFTVFNSSKLLSWKECEIMHQNVVGLNDLFTVFHSSKLQSWKECEILYQNIVGYKKKEDL